MPARDSIEIREYAPADRDTVLALAPRLTEGMARRRGRGVASALMAAAEAWGAGRGLRCLTLETGAANQPARSFYAALGYLPEDVRLTKDLRMVAG